MTTRKELIEALQPIIDNVYGFDDVPAAFEHLARGAFGKVVVSV